MLLVGNLQPACPAVHNVVHEDCCCKQYTCLFGNGLVRGLVRVVVRGPGLQQEAFYMRPKLAQRGQYMPNPRWHHLAKLGRNRAIEGRSCNHHPASPAKRFTLRMQHRKGTGGLHLRILCRTVLPMQRHMATPKNCQQYTRTQILPPHSILHCTLLRAFPQPHEQKQAGQTT